MLGLIDAALGSLSVAEQRVGRLLLEDPRAFIGLPVGEIAQRAQVSKPTVVRFCRSVGYQGLADCKLKLAAAVGEGVPFLHRGVEAADGAEQVATKVVDNTVAALLAYRNAVPAAALERATEALEQAWRGRHRIEFYGVGNSGIVAQDAQHKFFRLGLNTIAYSDGHLQVMSASLRQRGDVVVVISNSGRTRDLLDAAHVAKQQGATVIVLTASGSPLAQAGHIHLAANHPERYDRYSPMISRLLHLTIIDILATALALRIGPERLQPMLTSMKANLMKRRYA